MSVKHFYLHFSSCRKAFLLRRLFSAFHSDPCTKRGKFRVELGGEGEMGWGRGEFSSCYGT